LQRIFSPKFKRYIHEIFAGDYYATKEQNVVFSTILGSCISVCLKDRITGIAGMNHFMLPGKSRTGKTVPGGDARYGINSMEMLIESMLKIGAKKSALEAKVFGGGQLYEMVLNNIAGMNIDFITAYLDIKKIPVLASSVGGRHGRKLFFFSDTFTVYVKQINLTEIPADALQQEKRFLRRAEPNSVL
jgi:chemotaxis protein CheD